MRDLCLICPIIRGPGGIATYARSLLEALGPEPVHVLSQGQSREVATLPEHAHDLGSPASKPGYAAQLAREYLTRPPSVFLFAHVGLTAPLALLPRLRHHRVVLIGHGLEIWPRLPARRAVGLSHVDSFVFTARYNKALFLARNADRLAASAETAVIPLSAGARLEQQAPFPTPAGDRRRVVCITRLVHEEPLKGLPTLLAAARHLPPEWDVVIVGDGETRGDLEKLARELGVAARVRFTGWLSEAERTRQLAMADVFCLPSAQEGFGIVFLEAMVAGRPCVGAAAGAIPEVLAPEVGELFPYDDDIALAKAILRASERFHAREITPESVRQTYESRYSWTRFRDAWKSYLEPLRS